MLSTDEVMTSLQRRMTATEGGSAGPSEERSDRLLASRLMWRRCHTPPASTDPPWIVSVQPCENFYQYSCGNWIKNNPIPADQARWDVYGKLTNDNQLYLWGLLRASRETRPQTAHPTSRKSAISSTPAWMKPL